jgi:hypothetical protein
MQAKIIKEYNNLDANFLKESYDWDAVELNYDVDVKRLQTWYQTLRSEYPHCIFDFNNMPRLLEVEFSKQLVEQGFCGYLCGPIDGITINWPIERYEPLPPPQQAKKDIFPEVDYKSGGSKTGTFYNDAKILSKFKFGYFAELVDKMSEDAFRQTVIAEHKPGMYIKQHYDSPLIKMHIPIESKGTSEFVFGENRDRGYHFREGKAYLLNTKAWHGTENDCEHVRAHLISRVDDSVLQKVIDL